MIQSTGNKKPSSARRHPSKAEVAEVVEQMKVALNEKYQPAELDGMLETQGMSTRRLDGMYADIAKKLLESDRECPGADGVVALLTQKLVDQQDINKG